MPCCVQVCWKSKNEEEFREVDSSSWKYKNCKLRLNLRSQRLEASNTDLSGEGWWTRPSPESLPSILACACLRSDSSYSSLVSESWSASGCHEGLVKESLGFVSRNLSITCLRPRRWADDPLHQWSLLHTSTQQHVHSCASYTPTGCLTSLVTSRAAPWLLCSLRQVCFFLFFFSSVHMPFKFFKAQNLHKQELVAFLLPLQNKRRERKACVHEEKAPEEQPDSWQLRQGLPQGRECIILTVVHQGASRIHHFPKCF